MDIDFVVLWVDGNDPEWRAEKAKYQGAVTDDSNSVNRCLLYTSDAADE